MTALVERLIRIKDSLTDRADRDTISEACRALEGARTGTPQDTARAVINAVTSTIPKGSSDAAHRDHHLAAIKQLVCAVMSQTMDARAIRFAVDNAIQVGITINASIRERRNG